MNMFKRLAKRSVNHFGYEIHRIGTGSSRRTMADVLANVARLGFVPNVVIDVGVAKGTPALYNTFPDSYHLLIKPLEEFEEDIRSILKKYKGSYVIAAASSETGNIEINVHTDHFEGSSFYKETMGSEFDGVPRTVQTVRIDDLVKDRGHPGEMRSAVVNEFHRAREVGGRRSEGEDKRKGRISLKSMSRALNSTCLMGLSKP